MSPASGERAAIIRAPEHSGVERNSREKIKRMAFLKVMAKRLVLH
jgi:hypothetical protein